MLYTLEMSRRARGIELWALLKSLGRAGVDELVAQLCARARQFADNLATRKFRVLNDVVFNQVLVACETPELTRRTLNEIQSGGVCWCGGSEWRSEPVIRISVCSWATTEDDVAALCRRLCGGQADSAKLGRGALCSRADASPRASPCYR